MRESASIVEPIQIQPTAYLSSKSVYVDAVLLDMHFYEYLIIIKLAIRKLLLLFYA